MTRSRTCRLVCFLVPVLLVAGAGPASAGSPTPDDAGSARLVDEDGVGIDEGSSTTAFAFDLEGPDECQGDSQNGNYRTNSFMVPAEVQAADIEFDGLGPQPRSYGVLETFRMPMFDLDTADYTSGLTAQADVLGGPGAILDLRPLSFGTYRPGDLPVGEYRIGLVCTHEKDLTRYWDTTVRVLEDADDPFGFRWILTGSNDGVAASGGFDPPAIPAWLLVVAVGAALVGVFELRARRKADQSSPVEVG